VNYPVAALFGVLFAFFTYAAAQAAVERRVPAALFLVVAAVCCLLFIGDVLAGAH